MPYQTVRDALKTYYIYRLRDLVQLIADYPYPKQESELVQLIADYLKKEQNLINIYQSLDTLQQAVVAEVVHSDSNLYFPKQFFAKYQQEAQWSERVASTTGFEAQPTKLYLLFYIHNDYDQLVMPLDLKQKLTEFVPPPIPLKLETLKELSSVWVRRFKDKFTIISPGKGVEKPQEIVNEFPLTIRYREKEAINDLTAILRLINTGKISVSDKTGYPTAKSIEEITAILNQEDFYKDSKIGAIQPFAWCLLLQAGGLVEGKKLQLTNNGQKALTMAPENIIKQLWQKWLKNNLLDELKRINNIKGQTGKAKKTLTATNPRRKVITTALKDCPLEKWIAVKEFCRYVQAANYEWKITRNPDAFKFESGSFIDLGFIEASYHWQTFEARYLLCFLFEYMATLGLIDVAYVLPGDAKIGWSDTFADSFFSRYDGLIYFRLNGLGAYCLGLTSQYIPTMGIVEEIESKVKILPNLEIIFTGKDINKSEELILNLYAEKQSESVWHITENQLLKASNNGHNLADFQEFLTKLSNHPLPDTVRQLFQDLEQRVKSLNVQGMGIIIDCQDSALATLIANDSRTKKYCILAGEKNLVIPIEMETKFRNALLKLGYSL